jgi:multiple sugar transport system substrate-binding protein
MFRKTLFVTFMLLIVFSFTTVSLAQDGKLIVWSTEDQPDRIAATQAIAARFTEETGITVEVVPVAEDGFSSLVAANLAAGTLPDAMFLGIEFANTWANEGILDTEAATQVINDLGADTFASLNLVDNGEGGYYAVPSDAWGQLLVYRKDLFDAAGLAAPTDFASIEAAAAALNDPDNNFYGIVAATDPSSTFTQQTFEQFALANGTHLTDADGNVTLNTPEMIEALSFYTNLVSQYGPPGIVDVDNSRATYFAGQAAMLVWSPFILDEMAGLRDDALPNCAECAEDPAYLAKNSGLVPAFVGPSGQQPAQYGQVSLFGITTNADPETVQLVEFWLSDAYVDWLSIAPEGKFPMLTGTADNATEYVDTWRTLDIGVDRKAPIGDFYSEETIDALVNGATSFARWGLSEGQGELVGGVYQELVFPVLISDVVNGSLSVEEAVAEAQTQVEEIKADQVQ